MHSTPILKQKTHSSVVQVNLVANDNKREVLRVTWAGLDKKLVPPAIKCPEGIGHGDVEDKNTAVCPTVERYTQTLEPLLACGVPYLRIKAQHIQRTYRCRKQEWLSFQGFPTRMVYLHYISCLRYTILVGNPRLMLYVFMKTHTHTHIYTHTPNIHTEFSFPSLTTSVKYQCKHRGSQHIGSNITSTTTGANDAAFNYYYYYY